VIQAVLYDEILKNSAAACFALKGRSSGKPPLAGNREGSVDIRRTPSDFLSTAAIKFDGLEGRRNATRADLPTRFGCTSGRHTHLLVGGGRPVRLDIGRQS